MKTYLNLCKYLQNVDKNRLQQDQQLLCQENNPQIKKKKKKN